MPREGADDEADPASTAQVEAGASDYVIGGDIRRTGAASDSGRRNERPGSTDQDQADALGEIADLGTSRHALIGHRRRASQSSLSQGSNLRRQSLQEVLQLPFQPPPLTREPHAEWLKKRSRWVLKVLPGEVKAVHYREQQCAVLFWACLVFVFLAYSLYLTVQMFEQRLSPPQAVSFNDPNLVRRLDTFPNLVACFPQFGGPKVDWLPAAAIKHEWGLKNESKKEEASIILKPEACGLVSRTWNRDCLFYDGSNLTPKGATADRGLEIYLSYIRHGPAGGQPDPLIYRGAMLTMTDMSKESFCAVQNMDKSGIQWQEMPFEDPKFSLAGFLPYYEIELQLRMVTRLKKKWDPFRSQEPPYAEYNFIPRLASYHMGSDAAMLGPNSTDRLKTVMAQVEQGDYSQIPAIARFIITQREEVLSFQQMEPFQPFTLFGTLAGAWGGILGIFTAFFASTQGGRRRLPGFLRTILCLPARIVRNKSFTGRRRGNGRSPASDRGTVRAAVMDNGEVVEIITALEPDDVEEAEMKEANGEPPDLLEAREGSSSCLPRPHYRPCFMSWGSFHSHRSHHSHPRASDSNGSSEKHLGSDPRGQAQGSSGRSGYESDDESEGPDDVVEKRLTQLEHTLGRIIREPVLPSELQAEYEYEDVEALRGDVARMQHTIDMLTATLASMQRGRQGEQMARMEQPQHVPPAQAHAQTHTEGHRTPVSSPYRRHQTPHQRPPTEVDEGTRSPSSVEHAHVL